MNLNTGNGEEHNYNIIIFEHHKKFRIYKLLPDRWGLKIFDPFLYNINYLIARTRSSWAAAAGYGIHVSFYVDIKLHMLLINYATKPAKIVHICLIKWLCYLLNTLHTYNWISVNTSIINHDYNLMKLQVHCTKINMIISLIQNCIIMIL